MEEVKSFNEQSDSILTLNELELITNQASILLMPGFFSLSWKYQKYCVCITSFLCGLSIYLKYLVSILSWKMDPVYILVIGVITGIIFYLIAYFDEILGFAICGQYLSQAIISILFLFLNFSKMGNLNGYLALIAFDLNIFGMFYGILVHSRVQKLILVSQCVSYSCVDSIFRISFLALGKNFKNCGWNFLGLYIGFWGLSFFVCLFVNLYDRGPIMTDWIMKSYRPSSKVSIENEMYEGNKKVVKKIYAINENNVEISSIES